MKIFSSFDTNFMEEVLEKEQKIFGKNKVYVIKHGKFFLYFKLILPALIAISLYIGYISTLIYFSNYIPEEAKSIYYIVGIIVSFTVFGGIFIKLIKKYIDYILDFVIVTPNSLISYNQEGIFSRKGRTIDTEKIKTITINKNGILKSLFNFGDIIVLTEGDEQGEGEINFKYVDNPDEVKFKILEITKAEG